VGTFAVGVVLAHPGRPERGEPVKLLVDTGSAYTLIAEPGAEPEHTPSHFDNPGPDHRAA